ncbi:hypothetical protein [Salinibacterium sp. M195]|uniref:hypothetical protein n=1 Tax=Salinibacterium sp. M195 TaxID=2583374 RepID=UPI001C631062|nr:hypothetical protein [Salinibacterium sp. M195]QYH35454.1 hypothetical protein FFT87_05525 [Salinibacterium sp. M195]
MPRPRLVTLGVASVACASLLLAGCSSTGERSGELTYEDSPLYVYSTALYGGDRENDEYIAEANAAEELIAECMADEGFTYLPVDQTDNYSFDDSELADRNTEEWVAANGYGYNLTDEQQAAQNEEAENYVDPNQDYVMALSESEQTAYYEVLHGPQPTEEEMNDPDFSFEPLGCYGTANSEVRGDQIYSDPQYKNLIDSMSKLWEEQQETPEMKKFNAEWSSCMADAGHPDLATKDAVYDFMNAQSEEAWADGVELSKEKRTELRDQEIDLALADFHCSEDLDFEQKTLAAQFKLEEKFVAENKAELDEMLAAATQTK